MINELQNKEEKKRFRIFRFKVLCSQNIDTNYENSKVSHGMNDRKIIQREATQTERQ